MTDWDPEKKTSKTWCSGFFIGGPFGTLILTHYQDASFRSHPPTPY